MDLTEFGHELDWMAPEDYLDGVHYTCIGHYMDHSYLSNDEQNSAERDMRETMLMFCIEMTK